MAESNPNPTGTRAGVDADTVTEFATTLLELDKGRVHDDGTERLRELVKAVCHTGKKGKLKLTLEVGPLDPDTFEDTGVLYVSGAVEVQKPTVTRAPSVFYAIGANGSISRDDPSREDV